MSVSRALKTTYLVGSFSLSLPFRAGYLLWNKILQKRKLSISIDFVESVEFVEFDEFDEPDRAHAREPDRTWVLGFPGA